MNESYQTCQNVTIEKLSAEVGDARGDEKSARSLVNRVFCFSEDNYVVEQAQSFGRMRK